MLEFSWNTILETSPPLIWNCGTYCQNSFWMFLELLITLFYESAWNLETENSLHRKCTNGSHRFYFLDRCWPVWRDSATGGSTAAKCMLFRGHLAIVIVEETTCQEYFPWILYIWPVVGAALVFQRTEAQHRHRPLWSIVPNTVLIKQAWNIEPERSTANKTSSAPWQ